MEKITRRRFLWVSGVLTLAATTGLLWRQNFDSEVNTAMLASSNGVRLKEYLNDPRKEKLFPGLRLSIFGEGGKTIDWQREKIEKGEWLPDCSPFALVILNLALNDLLNGRPARDIFRKDFVSAYDEVVQRCEGKRICVFGAYPVSRRKEVFVQNQRDFNDLALFYAQSRGGLPINPFDVLADSDGVVKPGLSDDGTHINFDGWRALSNYATPLLLSFARS